MTIESVLDLPFHERPIRELLNLTEHRDVPQHDYAGYGWARVAEIWLEAGENIERVEDALVLALHTPDDIEPSSDDIDPNIDDLEPTTGDVELYFEVPGDQLTVDASLFFAKWLPELPRASAIVLSLCNPQRVHLRLPTNVPVYYALGDVESWLDHDEGGRVVLATDGSWAKVPA